MANRVATERTAIGLFHWSFNIIRTLSSSAQPPFSATAAAAAAAADATDPKKPKRKKNLFEVAQFLPNWGLGYKMAKSHWRDVSYEITKVNLYKDGRHGKAWGIRHKAEVIGSQKAACVLLTSQRITLGDGGYCSSKKKGEEP